MTRRLAVVTVVLLSCVVWMAGGYVLTRAVVYVAGHAHHSTQPRITEDDPRWNCHTMGNRVCGNQH